MNRYNRAIRNIMKNVRQIVAVLIWAVFVTGGVVFARWSMAVCSFMDREVTNELKSNVFGKMERSKEMDLLFKEYMNNEPLQ